MPESPERGVVKAARLQTEPTTPPAANGHGPPMERHYAWIAIEGYAGFEARVWSNAKQRTMLDLDADDSTVIKAALLQVVVGVRTVSDDKTWDAWFDCDGDPFPAVDDPAFYDALPLELYVLLRQAIRRAMVELPNSLARTRRI